MAQDFFFKLFAREFLASKEIRELSLQDQAILLRLWCVCCLDGVLPEDLEDLSIASGVKQAFLRSFERSLQRPFERFFQRDTSGRRFSPRMERERERNQKVRDSASNAGKASAEARRRKVAESNGRCNERVNSHSHIKNVPSQEEKTYVGTSTLGAGSADWAPPLPDGEVHS